VPSYSINSLHQETLSSTNVVDQSTRLSHSLPPPHDDVLSTFENYSSLVPRPNAPMDLPLANVTTGETNYNPNAIRNLKVVFREKDKENRWKVTEEERAYAKKCEYPEDLDKFTKAVRFLSSRRNWLCSNNLWSAPKTIETGI
jgi:hypothetical protein